MYGFGRKKASPIRPFMGCLRHGRWRKITSVFCGAADKDAFLEIAYKSKTGTHHAEYDQKTKELHKLYQQVRNRRHNGGDYGFLGNVWLMLQKFHHDDWLCALEILELLDHEDVEPALAAEISSF
jgi:phenylalanine-4-hydroxylase